MKQYSMSNGMWHKYRDSSLTYINGMDETSAIGVFRTIAAIKRQFELEVSKVP
jgi:hypothetical protein